MIEFFATLYVIMQAFAVLMAWPQIRKLYIAKKSSELSLTTWATWLSSALVTIVYAASTSQYVWMGANIGWATFYVVMVVMIIRYREQTIYEQTIELFKMRFYFAVGKKKAETPSVPHSFFDKFHRPKQ